jgi:hypothetical protein
MKVKEGNYEEGQICWMQMLHRDAVSINGVAKSACKYER